MSSRPQKTTGMKKKVAPSYLSDTFVTDDGIEVPPPTRPMGPRRLSRYYDEVADYLRALAGGEQELPPKPMFMGKVKGLDIKTDPSHALAGLSQMGNISTDEDDLEVDFDQNQVTVVHDPLDHIGQQILGQPDQNQSEAQEKIDFAASTLEFGGDSDFISVEELADGAAPGHGDDGQQALGTPQKPPSSETDSDQSDQTTPSVTDKADTAHVGLQAADDISGATSGAVGLILPTPVRAVDAQGLDLTELDHAPVSTSDTHSAESSLVAAEEADESNTQNQEAHGDVLTDLKQEQVTEVKNDHHVQATRASLISEESDARDVLADGLSHDDMPEPDNVEETHLTQASSQEEQSQGSPVGVLVCIFLLIALLVLVWFVFYS